jgi:hypothetical protein
MIQKFVLSMNKHTAWHNAKINIGFMPTAGPELTPQIEQCKDLHDKYAYQIS